MALPAIGLVFLALAAIAQSTVLTRLPIGLRPDLALLLVLIWAMHRSVVEGGLAGMFGGLALDVISAAPFGLLTSLLAAIGALTAIGETNVFRENWPLCWATAGLATLGLHGGEALALQAFGYQLPSFPVFVQIVAPNALINALLMPFIHTFIRRLLQWLRGWRPIRI